jgi:hypothetical protein
LRLFGSSWLLSSITTFHAGCASEPLSPKPVSAELPASIRPDPKWTAQAAEDAKQDFTSIPYDGIKPHSLVCDTTLRELPDGSWALFMMAGDDFEPSPKNYIGPTRSCDQRKTWSPLQPVPGRLATFTFIRNHIVTRDGPGHAMNCPDGFVSKDRQWLHFAYDDNRHRAVHYSAKLPPLQRSLLPRKVEVDRDRLAGKIDRLGELGADHPPRRRESVAPRCGTVRCGSTPHRPAPSRRGPDRARTPPTRPGPACLPTSRGPRPRTVRSGRCSQTVRSERLAASPPISARHWL